MDTLRVLFLKRLLAGILVIPLGLPWFALRAAAQVSPQVESTYRPGQVLVKLKGEERPRTFRFDDAAPVEAIASEIANQEGVEYAEPNYTVQMSAFDPNDPYYADQWYLRQISMPVAWERNTGSTDITVAVIDTGVDINHPDLRDNIWTNVNEIPGDGADNDSNGFVDDVHGWDFIDWSADPRPDATPPYSRTALHHGTVVAGVIGAVGNNQQGTAGITWRTRIMPLRVLDREGKGDVEQVAQAVDYAVRNGARVINLSFVGNDFSQRLYDSLRRAYLNNVVVVTAAGNVGEGGGTGDLDERFAYPVCYDAADTTGENWVVGVTATDFLDQRSPTANIGARCVDVAAPGVSFVSTQVYDTSKGLTQPYGGPWSGTSLAAPIVSGVAALILADQPRATAKQVTDRLLFSADDISSLNRAYAEKLGRGRINAARALSGQVTNVPTTTVGADGRIIVSPIGFRSSAASILTPSGANRKSWNVFSSTFRAGGGIAVSENGRQLPQQSQVKLTSILRGDQQIVMGDGPGGRGAVRLYDVTGALLSEWSAFGRPFAGGIEVASGNIYGNGEGLVAVAPLSGGGPQIRLFDREGKVRQQFFAYNPAVRGGFDLASGDIDGDGTDEIIVSSLTQSLPIRIFRGNGSLMAEWYPRENAKGWRIAVGDLDGDGASEVVVTPAQGVSANLAIYSGSGDLLGSFAALPASFRTAVRIAVGDVNSDGRDEIITAPASSGGSQVRIFDNHARVLGQFFVYDKRLRGGMVIGVLR